MIVAGARFAGGGIVEAADDVYVFAEGRQRGQAWSERVFGAGLRGNPVALRDAVAVKPEDEAGRNRRVRGVGGAVAVEHRFERRQADADGRAGKAHAAKKAPS